MRSRIDGLAMATFSRGSRGFTLIEALITVVMVAVLAAIALPSYQDQMRKARRSEAIEALSLIQSAQEKYRSSNTAYSSSLATLGFAGSPYTTGGGNYAVALSGTSATAYTLTATPVAGKAQAGDGSCLSIIVAVSAGAISQTPASCWNR